MQSFVKPATYLTLVVALVGAAHSAAAAGTANTRPSLRLLDDSPLRVAGKGFRARERVRLRTTVNGRRLRRTVTATASGRFSAQWQVDAECWPFVVYAQGASGSRATMRRIQIPPPCGPPPSP